MFDSSTTSASPGSHSGARASAGVEVVAGISTYLALSYIFLLNPILLARAGIDLSAAFFGTVVSAAFATLLMGVWAGLPFAVAPAPSITTFFVSFVCIKLGLPWRAALAAVVLSGILSVVMAKAAIRGRLIASVSPSLQVGTVFAVGGFLLATGLSQAKLVQYSGGLIGVSSSPAGVLATNALIFMTGLAVTVVFRLPFLHFPGAPVLGIVGASTVAALYGVRSQTPVTFSSATWSALGQVDFKPLLDTRFVLAMLVFFVIDFFGGVGKYIGLFRAMNVDVRAAESDERVKRALYVDGIGNIAGGFLGASSLAVFVSSAVGVVSGGRTGITAITTAACILLSLMIIPLVGAIPVEATSGVLVYVGLLLIPFSDLKRLTQVRPLDALVWAAAAGISIATYGIDKALCLVFGVYAVEVIVRGQWRQNQLLLLVTALLLAAVSLQAWL